MINKIINRLKNEYKEADCSLDFENPLQLIIATILAAQCTDERVNIVTKELFKKYKSVEDFANADLFELESIIKSTGFYHNKAKNIIACCKQLIEKYNGKVPSTMNELVSLPGVGRKTANVVLQSAYNVNEGIVVDTHCKRLSNRLGLTKHQDPKKIEKDLMDSIPRKYWKDFGHLLVFHGRAVCNARNPKCKECLLNDYCPRIGVNKR